MIQPRFGHFLAFLDPRQDSRHLIRAFIGHLCLAILLMIPLITKINTHILADDSFIVPGRSDAYTSLWSYWWIQKALMLGQNLLFCKWVLPPTGADLLFHTTSVAPTILTMPLAALFGTVAGYNLMIITMLVMGAWAYYVFLKKALPVTTVSAFLASALFGFCPYFIFKSHAHLNLIGACFWGGALAVLLLSYFDKRFSAARSILFALLLWLTFWTSFVEFFMLVVAVAAIVVVFELRNFVGNRFVGLPKRMLFFVPSVIGAIPAALWLSGKDLAGLARPLYDEFEPSNLLMPPKLAILSALRQDSPPEYWGTYLPLVVVSLSVFGIVVMKKKKATHLTSILLLTGLMLVITLDPFHLMSGLLMLIPFGTGFRVMARFFPIVLFFLLIPACYGLDRIMFLPRSLKKSAILIMLLIITCVEYVPIRLNPSPVAISCLTPQTANQLDKDKFVLLIPERRYENRDDTYQVAMDMRFVHLSYLAREKDSLKSFRETQYPIVYRGRPTTGVGELEDELRRLNVGYLLFERTPSPSQMPHKGRIVLSCNGMVLVDISRQLDELSP